MRTPCVVGDVLGYRLRHQQVTRKTAGGIKGEFHHGLLTAY